MTYASSKINTFSSFFCFFHICLLYVNQFCFITTLLLCTIRYLLFIVFTSGTKRKKRNEDGDVFFFFFLQISQVLSLSYVSTWVYFVLRRLSLSRFFACCLSHTKDEQARCYQTSQRAKLIDTRQHAPVHTYWRFF
jgi:hypothetical protein